MFLLQSYACHAMPCKIDHVLLFCWNINTASTAAAPPQYTYIANLVHTQTFNLLKFYQAFGTFRYWGYVLNGHTENVKKGCKEKFVKNLGQKGTKFFQMSLKFVRKCLKLNDKLWKLFV